MRFVRGAVLPLAKSALRGIALVSKFRVDPNDEERQRENPVRPITREVGFLCASR
jgi:hypothetical protein